MSVAFKYFDMKAFRDAYCLRLPMKKSVLKSSAAKAMPARDGCMDAVGKASGATQGGACMTASVGIGEPFCF
ncbi:MAG: hypothetical protein ABIP85_05750 [Chthoniobacteraceae bacterium]